VPRNEIRAPELRLLRRPEKPNRYKAFLARQPNSLNYLYSATKPQVEFRPEGNPSWTVFSTVGSDGDGMKPYELRLFRNDGTLVCAIPIDCADEKEARALFDQMKRKGFARVQLCCDGACIFDSAAERK
jgi:hypothetical protein